MLLLTILFLAISQSFQVKFWIMSKVSPPIYHNSISLINFMQQILNEVKQIQALIWAELGPVQSLLVLLYSLFPWVGSWGAHAPKNYPLETADSAALYF